MRCSTQFGYVLNRPPRGRLRPCRGAYSGDSIHVSPAAEASSHGWCIGAASQALFRRQISRSPPPRRRPGRHAAGAETDLTPRRSPPGASRAAKAGRSSAQASSSPVSRDSASARHLRPVGRRASALLSRRLPRREVAVRLGGWASERVAQRGDVPAAKSLPGPRSASERAVATWAAINGRGAVGAQAAVRTSEVGHGAP